MAFFYCYQPQQQSAQQGPQSPQSTTPELNTPLPSLLLLSPRTQPHLTLPLLTPVLPPVSMTTTATTTEHDDQQQLPTPNTFIRHCEDIGLFNDLQNIVNTTAAATTPTTNMSTTTKLTASPLTEHPSSSNFLGSLSTAMLKTMMMDNPFDQTFEQAVLRQEKKDTDLAENYFNNSTNNDGELNTPFIATTVDLNRTKTNNSKSAEKNTSDLVADFSTVEPKPVNLVDPKKQNSTVIPSTTEVCKFKATSSSVLVTRVEKKKSQKSYSTVFLQHQHQNPLIIKHRSIVSASILTNNVDTTSKKFKDQNFIDDEDGSESNNKLIHMGNESTKAKLALKQNLLKKQLLQERLRPVQSKKYHELRNLEQQKNDVVSTTTVELDNSICDANNHQTEELKKKQEQLERNRTAAKRSRKKRKERWELLSEENHKLKIENRQLRKIISKLIGREYSISSH